MFNPDIYRSYDIRGIYPDELPKEEAYHIGRAFAQFIGEGRRVVLARDMRVSGDQLAPEFLRGLLEGGLDVVNIGMATSPLFYYAVHHFQADGGAMVTASHNPGNYNGFKMTKAEAVPIAGSTGLQDIRDLVERRDWPEVSHGEVTEDTSARAAYLDWVCEGADGIAEGMKIVVDVGNGMVGTLLPDVFERLGGEVVRLYWEPDGNFPNHEANPLIDSNNKDALQAVREHAADFAVMFDGDGDRVFFASEKAETVPGDITNALLARELLKDNPGGRVLYDLRSTHAVPEVIVESGGEPLLTRVGHSYIKATMREKDAFFAGEVSGHIYFTPWYAESALKAMVVWIQMVKDSGKKVSELVDPLVNRYATSDEINFEIEDKESAMERIKEKYSDGADNVYEMDGLTIEHIDWWTNVRPSGTEPLLRMKVEAKTPELLKKMINEIEGLIGGVRAAH